MPKQDNYDSENWWSERFREYAHTGWSDDLIYAYDQPLRLRAVSKALKRAGIAVGAGTKVLDIGCGTGDFAGEFAKKGAFVLGNDISREAIRHAQKRFGGNANMKFSAGDISRSNFVAGSFDIAISITVLQHITEENSFLETAVKLVEAVKPGGIILIFETVAPAAKSISGNQYQVVRAKEEYKAAFEKNRCSLVSEMNYPQLGVKLCEGYAKTAKWMISLGGNLGRGARLRHDLIDQKETNKKNRLYDFGKKCLLFAAKPFDYNFMPIVPRRSTAPKILVFKKSVSGSVAG
ncbi:MAG: class I SAM-dependent methyltransferase [Candidatus Pacebacteria bacterium]|jgi:2-polyprenyl-3-methyl-5-hydroxy-6-metoxy-1,4-benzoquinol methylase|nr:class I SAM-dependent methyltransferase [Candidatus Paceibacterota bacterium]